MLQLAVTKMHKDYPSAQGIYVEVCSDCASLPDDIAHRGCSEHLGRPSQKRRVDSVTDPDFLKTESKWKTDVKDIYEAQSAC